MKTADLVTETAALLMEQMEAHATAHAKAEIRLMYADEDFDGFDKHYTEDQAKHDAYRACLDKLEWGFVEKALNSLDSCTITPSQHLKLAVALKIASTHTVP
jgi:hypothetical protein